MITFPFSVPSATADPGLPTLESNCPNPLAGEELELPYFATIVPFATGATFSVGGESCRYDHAFAERVLTSCSSTSCDYRVYGVAYDIGV